MFQKKFIRHSSYKTQKQPLYTYVYLYLILKLILPPKAQTTTAFKRINI